ncbi:hypothetical protein ACIBCM_14880 [Streptomyces sp. NPDC051018]|uniref:hypothetical protein n=1 Tax=Streptomyces sp. NPDC051018 TaxID=3365639 RepID=UPI0037B81FA5
MMREVVARALSWALALLEPDHPRQRHVHPPHGPGEDLAALEVRRKQQARRRALHYAALGIDHPYTYPGAPFPAHAFPGVPG